MAPFFTQWRDAAALQCNRAEKQKFWSKVVKTDECWTYPPTGKSGYGYFWAHGASIRANRCVLLWRHPRPAGKDIMACHKCRTKNCVRPSHLYWGNAAQNAQDKIKDGTTRPKSHLGENHPAAKLTENQVCNIWHAWYRQKHKMKDIANEYGVKTSAVSSIVGRRTWKEVTDKFTDAPRTRFEWSFPRGEKHHKSKITSDDAREIRLLLGRGMSCTSIGERFHISGATVNNIGTGRIWKHLLRSTATKA